MDSKIKLSNKIYPYFYGISSDLMFFITIDTMFFSLVKGYSDAKINFFVAFAMMSILILQPINLKIIKKIGNINSIKLSMWILLVAAIIITFSNNYYITLIGYALYEIAYIYKSMESVVLKRNLIHLNESDRFIEIQSKGATIYSIITLIISLIAGYLFTVNNYLPMYLCIGCCVINIILTYFLYEVDYSEEESKRKKKFKFNKLLIVIMLAYCLGYPMMSLAQSNSKLFIQKDLLNLLDVQKTSIYLVTIVAISRIVRTAANLVFPKVYNKLKDKVLYLAIGMFIFAHVFILTGAFLNNMIGIYIMSLGYFIYLAVRDPYQTYIKDIFLTNSNKNSQEEAITYLALAKNANKFILSLIITLILLKFDLFVVFYMFLVLSIIELFVVSKLYKMLNKNA